MNNLSIIGGKVSEKELHSHIECKRIGGVYPVEKHLDEDGVVEYVSSTDPTGYLIVFDDEVSDDNAIYLDNTVGTTCLADLL